MSFNGAIVWLDHASAQIRHFLRDRIDPDVLVADPVRLYLTAKTRPPYGAEDDWYFDDIAAALKHAGAILIVGPGEGKSAFARHLARRCPALSGRVVGIETLDRPADGPLLACARKHFLKAHATH